MVSSRRFSFSMRLVPPDFTNRAGEPSLKPPTELGTPSQASSLDSYIVLRPRATPLTSGDSYSATEDSRLILLSQAPPRPRAVLPSWRAELRHSQMTAASTSD